MKNNLTSPILITGIERSGSSIIAKMLNLSGAYVGEVSPMIENEKLIELTNYYYKEMHINMIPDTKEMLIPNDWQKKVFQCLEPDYDHNIPWLFKSHTLAQIWPVWNFAFPNAKWIIVRRRTGDIINSCMETAYMDTFKYADTQQLIGVSNEHDGWLWWIHQHEKIFSEMIESGLNCKQIWPERMVVGDYQQMYETLEWVGLPWKHQILNIIDPMLWNSREKERSNK